MMARPAKIYTPENIGIATQMRRKGYPWKAIVARLGGHASRWCTASRGLDTADDSPVKNQPYTEEDFKLAQQLRNSGWKWAAIATKMGRPEESLRSMHSLWRKGKWHTGRRYEKARDREIKIELLIEQGVAPVEIGRRLGYAPKAINSRLNQLGWDKETRALYSEAA